MTILTPTLLRALDLLPITDLERATLREGLERPEAHIGVQSILTNIPDQYAKRHLSPQDLTRYQTIRACLPSAAPFSLVPISTFIVACYATAALVYPDLDLFEGARQSARENAAQQLPQFPVFGAMFRACGGDPRRFLEIGSVPGPYFEDGELYVLPATHPRQAIVRFERLPVAQMQGTLHGFYEGVFQVFGDSVDVFFDLIADDIIEVHLDWS